MMGEDPLDSLMAPAAKSGEDPLDALIRSRVQQKATASILTSDVAPDAAGKANILARDYSLPPTFVDRNLPELQRQADASKAQSLMARYPAVGHFVTDPRNAAISIDDLDNLGHNSKLWGAALAAKPTLLATLKPPVGNDSYIGASFRSGLNAMMAAFYSAGAAQVDPVDMAKSAAGPVGGDFLSGVMGLLGLTRAGDYLNAPKREFTSLSDEQQAKVREKMSHLSPSAQAVADLKYATLDSSKSAFLSPTRIAGDASASLPTMAALALTGYLTRGASVRAEAEGLAAGLEPAAAKALGVKAGAVVAARTGALSEGTVGAFQQKAQTRAQVLDMPMDKLQQSPAFKQLTAHGYTPAAAREAMAEAAGNKAGLIAGAVDAVTNLASGPVLGKIIGEGGSLLPRVGKGFLTEGTQEAVQSGGEQLGGNIAMLDADPHQALMQGVLENALQGFGVGGIMGGATSGAAGHNHAEAVQAVVSQIQNGSVIAGIDAAADSKVRGRDPEAFRQFVAQHTDGSPIENIYVPAEKVAAFFQSNDGDYHGDQFWKDYAPQIDEGLATGGDVVIPTAAAAAHLSGTPVWEAIKPDVRTSPGGMSTAEAEAVHANAPEVMAELGAAVADEHAAAAKADIPRQKIYQDIRDKLTNAGRTQDAAHTEASLVAQRYATRAERLGVPLKGDETAHIEVNSVLPPNLAPIVATDKNAVALKGVIAVMRGGAVAKSKGVSLLDWIAKQGGIEDRGGDFKAMGLAPMKGASRKGERKLIRAHADLNQGEMIGGSAQQNANSPDELAMRAQEAGYFPAGERPTVNDLHAAIEAELRGSPRYPVDHSEGRVRAAADELTQMLDQAGLDPAKATDAEIKGAIDAYAQAQAGDYQQTFADGPRGQISFVQGKSMIDLFQARNLSTFVHELGHNWLEEIKVDAALGGQLAEDWNTVTAWFKANGHEVVGGQIPTDAHELFARGFERFVMEGKSPSSALRRVFDAFRSWLLNIYQVVDNLNAPITPEIRDVMSRLIATDEEIAQANQKQALTATFDREQLGMSEAEFAAFQNLAGEAKGEAHDALLYRTMQTIRQARTQAWKDEEAGVRADVTERVNRQPAFKALHLLRTGKMLDNAEAPQISVKLDKQWLIDTYGEGILAMLPKRVPPIYGDKATTHADEIAEMVGFKTGDEMVRTLAAVEERKAEMTAAGDKRSVRQRLIDDETLTEMRDRHGDPLNDGSIEIDALAAVHNERQGEVIAAEIRSLSRRAGRLPTPYSLAKEWAREKIAAGTVQETTSGAAIQRYARAAAKAAKLAEAAIIKGDAPEAYRQKQAQMLNNALVAEAGRVRDLVESAVARLSRYAKRATIKSMDQDYLDQIHALLEQVEFRNRSQTSIDRQQSFKDWARAQEAEGRDVVVPPSFAVSLGTTHWSRLTTEKLLGLDDTVKQIAHLGRMKQELLDGKERREFDQVVAEAVDGAGRLKQKPPSDLMEPAWTDRFKSGVASADAALLKMETIFDWLDGGNAQGVFNRIAFKPIADAQDRENAMLKDYYGRIREAMAKVPKETIRRWGDRVTVPELLNRETGNPFVLSRQALVAAALNVGNEGNFQRLADGYGWNKDALTSALNRELTAGEWQFVQETWDIIDTLWPELSAMHRRVNGVAPDKVEPRGFDTPHGAMRGGYYPAIYDSTKSLVAENMSGKSSDLFETNYTRATTRASATQERANAVKQPILLQLGVINRHLGEVIHDITHREAVINADKFLSSKRVMAAVDKSLGPEIRKQFRPWLKFVANQWAIEKAGNEGLGKWLQKAQSNATIVGMGYRVTTMMTQLAGYSNSFEYVGEKWVTAAIAKTTAHPIETFKFVTERSGEIRDRMDTLDRDIRAGIKQLAGKHNPLADAKRLAFHGIGYMDRVVSIPTWIGAYDKAIATGADEEAAIYEGDKAVRKSQGSGSPKDLAAVQRGTGQWGRVLKILTMFYSYLSTVYQRNRTLGRDIAQAGREHNLRATPRLVARALWLVAVPPVLSEILAGRGPGHDEDWRWWSIKKMMSQLLGGIPGVRDLVEPTWDAIAGNKTFGYQMSPLQRAGDSIVTTGKDIGHILRGKETEHATKDVLDTVGYATGLVPGQVASAAQFFVDLGNGDQHADTLGDWYRGITTGKAEARH